MSDFDKTFVTTIAAAITFLAMWCVITYLLHRDKIAEAERQEEERRDHRELNEALQRMWQRQDEEKLRKSAAASVKEAAVFELSKLSWEELRARCSGIDGEPCECSTREQIAGRVYDFEVKREKRRANLAAHSNSLQDGSNNKGLSPNREHGNVPDHSA